MPTYEYRCTACGEHLEVVQSFTDDALTECPACGGSLRKVFGNIGITFKGSGFYKTDNRAGSKKTSPAKDGAVSGDSAAAKSGDSKSGDSKSSDSKSSDGSSNGSKRDASSTGSKSSGSPAKSA